VRREREEGFKRKGEGRWRESVNNSEAVGGGLWEKEKKRKEKKKKSLLIIKY